MNEKGVKKCPKCGARMEAGKLLARYSPIRHYDLVFENAGQHKLVTEKQWVVSYACGDCGYLETYVEDVKL